MPTKTSKPAVSKSTKKTTSKPAKSKNTSTISNRSKVKTAKTSTTTKITAKKAPTKKGAAVRDSSKSKTQKATTHKAAGTKTKKAVHVAAKKVSDKAKKSVKTTTEIAVKDKGKKEVTKKKSAVKAKQAEVTEVEPIIKEKKVAKKIMRTSTVETTTTKQPTDISGAGFLGIPPYQEESNEDYMNVRQQGHFRSLLERWKQALMEEVDRTMHHMKDEADNFPDLIDRASQEEEFNLELRARDRERKLIWKIDEALERIERNDYGYCDACGIEIGIRRLEARPTATLCIDCKTLDEIREKQTRA